MSILEVRNVSKSFGEHVVLDNVSFSLDEAGIVALVGPNGSGKSTLLNGLVNLLEFDQGSVTFFGKSPTDVSVFNDVSYLKDNTVLYPYLSAYDHLSYASKVYGVGRDALEELIDKVGIRSYLHKKVQDCSLGMKQHILFALALLNKPKLIIMDEPLTGLDPTNVLRVRALLKRLAKEGHTILMSSHDLSEIDEVTNDVLFLKDGKLIREKVEGTCQERYLELFAVEI